MVSTIKKTLYFPIGNWKSLYKCLYRKIERMLHLMAHVTFFWNFIVNMISCNKCKFIITRFHISALNMFTARQNIIVIYWILNKAFFYFLLAYHKFKSPFQSWKVILCLCCVVVDVIIWIGLSSDRWIDNSLKTYFSFHYIFSISPEDDQICLF